MLKQEKNVTVGILRSRTTIKEEDAKAQFAMDNIDVKRDIMVNRERLEEEVSKFRRR